MPTLPSPAKLRRATAAVGRALDAAVPAGAPAQVAQVYAEPNGRVYELTFCAPSFRSGHTYDSSTDTPDILGAATRAVRAHGTPAFAARVLSLAARVYTLPQGAH
jgi:hypothetical protein